jgi:hypothetical protein
VRCSVQLCQHATGVPQVGPKHMIRQQADTSDGEKRHVDNDTGASGCYVTRTRPMLETGLIAGRQVVSTGEVAQDSHGDATMLPDAING